MHINGNQIQTIYNRRLAEKSKLEIVLNYALKINTKINATFLRNGFCCSFECQNGSFNLHAYANFPTK